MSCGTVFVCPRHLEERMRWKLLWELSSMRRISLNVGRLSTRIPFVCGKDIVVHPLEMLPVFETIVFCCTWKGQWWGMRQWAFCPCRWPAKCLARASVGSPCRLPTLRPMRQPAQWTHLPFQLQSAPWQHYGNVTLQSLLLFLSIWHMKHLSSPDHCWLKRTCSDETHMLFACVELALIL